MATLAAEWVQQGRQQGIEEGIQQGVQQGVQQGYARKTLQFLQRHFGALEENLRQRIYALPIEALERLGDDSFDFRSVTELIAWLDHNTGDAGLKH